MAKPSDFFVGVTDLFSILLPGAAITYACLRLEQLASKDVLLLRQLETKEGWVAFFVVAYLLGHVLDMAGAFVLDPLYDATYANWKRSSSTMKFKEWMRCRLRWMQKEERDRTSNLNDTLLQMAQRRAALTMPPKDRVYQWSRTWTILKSPLAFTEIERLQANSKFFRGMVSFSVVAMLLLPFSKITHKSWVEFACLVLAMTSFIRFCGLRWKAVQQTYRFFIALSSEPMMATASESRNEPDED